MGEQTLPGGANERERLRSKDPAVRADLLTDVFTGSNGLLLTLEPDGATTCAAFGVFGPREWMALLAVVQQLGNQMGLALQWVPARPKHGGLVLPGGPLR